MAKKNKFVRLLSPIIRAGLIPYIINTDGTMDVCTMVPSDPKYGGGEPQMGKGRIDEGYNSFETAIKEAREELGYIHKTHYDVETLMDNMSGIRIYCVEVDDKDLDEPGHETSTVQWLTLPNDLFEIREWQQPIFDALYHRKGPRNV